MKGRADYDEGHQAEHNQSQDPGVVERDSEGEKEAGRGFDDGTQTDTRHLWRGVGR